MEINFTIEVALSFTSVVLSAIGAFLIYRQNQKNPDRALVFLILSFLSLTFFMLFSALGYLFLSPNIFLLKNVFLVTLALFITMGVTMMTRGQMITLQLVVVSFLSSFAIAIFLLPNNVEHMEFANGDRSLQNVGYNRAIIAVLMLYVVITLMYFSIKIYRHSSPKMRKDSQLFLLGNSITGILGLGAFVSGLSTIVPGIVELLISLGLLIASIGLIRTPQILYILPFNAIKLSVIRGDSGISFYNYYWDGSLDIMSDQLFGAAFLAISNFMDESVGEGSIEEVKLESATMSITKAENKSIYYVVVATKPSYVLKKGLEQFARRFNEIYGAVLLQSNVFEMSQFERADELIPECFPYIPVID